MRPLQFWPLIGVEVGTDVTILLPAQDLEVSVAPTLITIERALWWPWKGPGVVLYLSSEGRRVAVDLFRSVIHWHGFTHEPLWNIAAAEKIANRIAEMAQKIPAANGGREPLTPERLMGLSPRFFELAVRDRFQSLGIRVSHLGMSGDGGVDLSFEFEGEKWVVQCKRHQARIPPKTVRELIGAMVIERAAYGILVSVNGYTAGAGLAARGRNVALLDYQRLSRLTRDDLRTMTPQGA